MIVGISGRKQSGKSTVGMFLMEHLENVSIVNFADELKELCVTAYGASNRQVNGSDEDKNEILETCGMSSRQLMQRLGAAMRAIWPDCWIYAWQTRSAAALMTGAKTIIVADVRYPNEVAAIHAEGGVVIRLERSIPMDIYSYHESETALDGFGKVGRGRVEGGNRLGMSEGYRMKDQGASDGVWFDLELGNEVLGIEQTNALALAWVRKQMREREKPQTADRRPQTADGNAVGNSWPTSEVVPCL